MDCMLAYSICARRLVLVEGEEVSHPYIKTVADAKTCIGKRVYWDDVSSRYVFLRSGIIESVKGWHVEIDGDHRHRCNLKNLRNFENGGEWKRQAQ